MTKRTILTLLAVTAVFLLSGTARTVLGAGIVQGVTPGSGTFTTTTDYTGKIQVSSPMLITTAGYYILTQDITAEGSAFGIKCADVTLDLNGHTITYGTGTIQNTNAITYNSLQSGNVGHHAIVCPDDPRQGLDYSFGWNYNFSGIVIKNGTITQGGGTGLAYSDALVLTGANGADVNNLVINVSAPDSGNAWVGSNTVFHNNTLNSSVTVVSNRHQQMYELWSQGTSDIHENLLDSSPQEGVKCGSGDTIYNNLIKTRVTVTNGYGIMGSSNVTAYNNSIIAYNGRGIHVNNNNILVHDNYVEIRETGNAEYSTMQTHGIKFESGTNSTAYNNVVAGYSTTNGSLHGQPTALNLDIAANSNNNIYNNRFTSKNLASEQAWSLYLIASDGTGSTIKNSEFYSNVKSVAIPWDGASNHTIRQSDFRKITSGDSVTFIQYGNSPSVTSTNQKFIDCQYYGIDPKSCTFYTAGAAADYSVGWSLGLTANNGGTALDNASVTITDTFGATAASGTTDGDGKFSADLMEFKKYHVLNVATVYETDYSPYTVTISKAGYPTRQFTLNSLATMEASVDVSGSGLLNLSPSAPKRAEWGKDYKVGLTTSGTAAESWAINTGSLPSGLSISGSAITGTPTKVGIYKVNIGGTSDGSTAYKDMMLIVTPQTNIRGQFNFTGTAGGTKTWADSANWAYAWGVGCGNGYPSDAGKTANFSVDLTSNLTVNLGDNITVGSLILGDNYNTKYVTTFSNTGGYSITIDNGGNFGEIKCLGSGNYDIINTPIILNDSIYPNGNWRLALRGAISGTGGIVIRRTDNGASFEAANTYTGDTVIIGSGLTLSASAAAVTGSNIAAYDNNSGTTILTLGSSSGSNANSDRIGDTKTVSMRGGSFYLYGNSAAALTENMGALELGWGESLVRVYHNAGQNTTLQASSFSRQGNSTGMVLGVDSANDLGGASKVKFTTSPATVGGNGGNGTNKPIIPSLRSKWYDVSLYSSYVNTFVTYDANNGVVPLNPASDYFQADNTAGKTIMDTASDDNVRIIGADVSSENISVTDNKTVNSLLFHTRYSSGNNTCNINITSGKTLTVASGGLIVKRVDNNNSTAVYFNTGTLNFGSNDGIFVAEGISLFRVAGDLTGSGGITVAAGSVYLQGTPKTYTGNTTVNHGKLYVGTYQGINAAGVLPNGTTVVLRNNNGGYVNGGANNKGVLNVQTGGTGSTSREKIANLRGSGIVNMGSTGKMVIGQSSTKGGSDIAAGELVLDGGTIYVGDSDTNTWDQDGIQIASGSFTMADGTLSLNIGGLAEYGYLALTTSGKNAVINGGELSVTFLPGFVPNDGDVWDIITTTSGTVTYNGFDSITTNAPGTFSISGGGTSKLTITYDDAVGFDPRPIPEPATLALLALGSLMAIRRRNR